MYEIAGECECFASEGTHNCDQECAACTNTTYTYDIAPYTLEFSTGSLEPPTTTTQPPTTTTQPPTTTTTTTQAPTTTTMSGEEAYKQSQVAEQQVKAQQQQEQSSKTQQEQATKTASEQAQKTYEQQQGGGGFGGMGGGYRLRSTNDLGHLHFIHDGQYDPTIQICVGATVTFKRTTEGHPLRLVRESDCTECRGGKWTTMPTTSLLIDDVRLNEPRTFTFTEAGTYYYVCPFHSNMVGKIEVTPCGGSIGVCDASRGLCDCLPPYTIETHAEYRTWKGDVRTKLVKKFDMPQNVTENERFRIRMMQGKKSFIQNYIDTSTTDDNWEETFDAFMAEPSQYTCAGKPCDFHDTVLLGNLADSSFSYNYDCAKTCPATDEKTKIPCSGHGRCGITGSCICDPAKVIKGTDAASGTNFVINVYGGESIQSNEFLVSKLDQTGWRGEDCSIRCPGYDDERQDMTQLCSGHGVCNLDGECQCELGYTGEVCQFTCPNFNEGDKNVCSGHGTCSLSEVQVYRDIFEEYTETYFVNGEERTRSTYEQRQCNISATKEVCIGYSTINDIGYLDLSKIYMIKEDSICASPMKEKCKTLQRLSKHSVQKQAPV